jgi:hypothetical protein
MMRSLKSGEREKRECNKIMKYLPAPPLHYSGSSISLSLSLSVLLCVGFKMSDVHSFVS